MSNLPASHITVHCSASKPSLFVDAAVIDRWHRQRGFVKIGYHYVILRTGRIEEGRALNEPGAHVEGHNTGNLGICLVGGLNDTTGAPEDNFTLDQYHALAQLLLTLTASREVTTSGVRILGHREWPGVSKACPCFPVGKWYSETVLHPFKEITNEKSGTDHLQSP